MYLCSNNICSQECIRCYVLGEDTFDRVAEQYSREVATPHERGGITATRSPGRGPSTPDMAWRWLAPATSAPFSISCSLVPQRTLACFIASGLAISLGNPSMLHRHRLLYYKLQASAACLRASAAMLPSPTLFRYTLPPPRIPPLSSYQ